MSRYAAALTRHTRSILVVAAALAVAGLVAALSLPVGLFPQVSFPRVLIDLDAGDRPADQMVLAVTRPVEAAVRGVPGVRQVRSATSRGSAEISVDFDWGRDMVAGTLQIAQAVQEVLPRLPAGTAYSIRRMDPTVYPIIAYALTGSKSQLVALRDFAQYTVVPLLTSIRGLGRAEVQGGETAEVEVDADPHLLALYGIGLGDIVAALGQANVLQAVGRLQDREKLYLVLTERRLTSAAQVGDVVLRAGQTGLVRLRDVARVRMGTVPQYIGIEESGHPAVLLNVYEQPDGNAVQVARDVRQRLAGLALPPGARLVKWYDQSTFVLQSEGSVRDAVLIGLLLAGVVLYAFLRNFRVTVIAGMVVPAILAVTVLVLSVTGQSFNIMTLGGIAAAVGLLIDDVIVMVEHIARRAGAAGAGGADEVMPAAREFLQPLGGSSLATLIVFVPLSFLSGVTGAFSRALSLTMAGALLISMIMTASVVPLLARHVLDFRRWRDPGGGGWLERRHTEAVRAVLRRRGWLAVALVPVAAVGWLAFSHVQTGFMPQFDEGGFVMDFYTPPGTSLPETERIMAQVDRILLAQPETRTFSRRLGTSLGGGLGESYHGDYFVLLKKNHARSTETVMTDVADEIGRLVPGVQIETAQLMEDLIGDLTAVPEPIEIKLFSNDNPALMAAARRVADAIGGIDGVVEVKNGIVLAGDALDIEVDPAAASIEGLTPGDVSTQIATALEGTVATELPGARQFIGVRVHVPGAFSMRQDALGRLPVRAPDGHLVPLSRVARISILRGQPQISREDLQPMLAVTGRIEGRGIGAAIADVKRVLARPGMIPPGMRVEFGGLYAQQQMAFRGLAEVFLAAAIAEFALLIFLYEQFWLPAIILFCSLLSTTAVFTGLWVAGVQLNITALMGMTMIIGIGTEMAIFYASEYTELSRTMPRREALAEAARNRLRPIAMTTLAAILTLAPLAFAIGAGSGLQQPLAIAVIAGLLLQFPLVLVAMPGLISLTLKAERATG